MFPVSVCSMLCAGEQIVRMASNYTRNFSFLSRIIVIFESKSTKNKIPDKKPQIVNLEEHSRSVCESLYLNRRKIKKRIANKFPHFGDIYQILLTFYKKNVRDFSAKFCIALLLKQNPVCALET